MNRPAQFAAADRRMVVGRAAAAGVADGAPAEPLTAASLPASLLVAAGCGVVLPVTPPVGAAEACGSDLTELVSLAPAVVFGLRR